MQTSLCRSFEYFFKEPTMFRNLMTAFDLEKSSEGVEEDDQPHTTSVIAVKPRRQESSDLTDSSSSSSEDDIRSLRDLARRSPINRNGNWPNRNENGNGVGQVGALSDCRHFGSSSKGDVVVGEVEEEVDIGVVRPKVMGKSRRTGQGEYGDIRSRMSIPQIVISDDDPSSSSSSPSCSGSRQLSRSKTSPLLRDYGRSNNLANRYSKPSSNAASPSPQQHRKAPTSPARARIPTEPNSPRRSPMQQSQSPSISPSWSASPVAEHSRFDRNTTVIQSPKGQRRQTQREKPSPASPIRQLYQTENINNSPKVKRSQHKFQYDDLNEGERHQNHYEYPNHDDADSSICDTELDFDPDVLFPKVHRHSFISQRSNSDNDSVWLDADPLESPRKSSLKSNHSEDDAGSRSVTKGSDGPQRVSES